MKFILQLISIFIFTFSHFGTAQVGTWSQKNNFQSFARAYPLDFSIGDKGYVGDGIGNGQYYSDFWEYDPTNDTWTQKANFPVGGRFAGTAFSIGDRGYAGIGDYGGGSPSSDFWEYNPQSNTWSQKANYPGVGKIGAVGFSIGNKGYIATGSPSSAIGNETNDFWEYDPATDSWEQKPFFPGISRDRAVGFSINQKGYVGTGYYYDGAPHTLNDFWEYDPSTEIWTQKADLPAQERSNAIGFSLGDYGFLGIGSQNQIDFWSYEPATDTWTQMAFFPGQARLGSLGLAIGNKGFVGLGYYVNGSTPIYLNDFWQYENELLNVEDILLDENIIVYPNPTMDNITLSLGGATLKNAIIYDLTGKQVISSSSNIIDVSNISSGLYIVDIITDKGSVKKRFLKK